MRVVLLGFGTIAARTLDAVQRSGFTVAAVLTHRAREENPLEETARAAGLPLLITPIASPETAAFLQGVMPDVLVSVNYRSIVPPEVLALPRRGAINVHGSMLPKYRGRTPAVWAIIDGERHTGITVHRMIPEVDAGDILLQEEISLSRHDTGGSVVARFEERAPDLVVAVLRQLAAGTADPRPQDHTQATYGARRTPEMGGIQWHKPAPRIYDWIRALTHPYPGAFTSYGGRRVWIWEASLLDEADLTERPPGMIVGVQVAVRREQCGVIVAAAPGRLVIHRLQFEGEPEGGAYESWEEGRLEMNHVFG